MADRMSQDRAEIEGSKFSGTGDFPHQMKIKRNEPNVLRLVKPDEYQKCFVVWLVCDDGERRRFVVENEHEGRSVLSEIIGDRRNYYRGGILETKKGDNNKKVYVWENPTDPEIMDIVKYNNDRSGRAGNWKMKTEFLFNIIDRSMEPDEQGSIINWCEVNKKTKLLTLGPTAFEYLVDTRDNNGPLDEYDINYTKKGEGLNTKHFIQKAGDRVPGVVVGPISEDELKYETWDLKKASALSSATYILKYLETTLTRIDNVMGTKKVIELKKQADIEQEEWSSDSSAEEDAVKSSVVQTSATSPFDDSNVPPVQQEQQTVKTAAPVTTRTPSRVPVSEEKTFACSNCGAKVPENQANCPSCSMTVQAPCDECGTLFPLTATECPVCGKTYKVE